MHYEVFYELAKSLGRPDLMGPLALGLVPTDLFAYALGLKKPSSLSKKLSKLMALGIAPPERNRIPGTRRWGYTLESLPGWHARAVTRQAAEEVAVTKKQPCPDTQVGRPKKSERIAASRLGMSVPEYRRRLRGQR